MSIKELSEIEHIRYRPGMYLGLVGFKGFTGLVKGLFSNSIENLSPDLIELELLKSNSGIIKVKNINNPIIDYWSKFHNNTSYSNWSFNFIVLNALSEEFKITLYNKKGEIINEEKYSKGIIKSGNNIEGNIPCDTLKIEFTLDKTIWDKDFKWNNNILYHEMRELAYLHKKTQFIIQSKIEGKNNYTVFSFKNGLKDKIETYKPITLHNRPFDTYLDSEINQFRIEAAFVFSYFSNKYSSITSYANDHFTSEGGSHVDGVLSGIKNALNKYINENNIKGDFKISKKKIRKHIVLAISIRMEEPVFCGATQEKFCSEINKPISKLISRILMERMERNKEDAINLLEIFKTDN